MAKISKKKYKPEPRPPEYHKWAKAVKERDGWKCVHCGETDKRKLHAHHLKSWARFPDLRYILSNGETCCCSCHIEIYHPELKNLMLGKKTKKARRINKKLKILNKSQKKKLISYRY